MIAPALLGLIVGAVFIGYPVGTLYGEMHSLLVWNLSDVHSSERFMTSDQSKAEVLEQISRDAFARQRNMVDKIKNSYLVSILISLDKGTQKGMSRMESQAAKKMPDIAKPK